MKKLFLIFTLFVHNAFSSQEKADMVIYSFDRPLQLYALLESIEKYITNLGEINIIYRTSNDDFFYGYEEVKNRFKTCIFHKQGINHHQEFRELITKCVFGSPNDYLLFAVDDIIIKDYVDISKCINALKKTNAYAFYLRLGKNITECYMESIKTPVPPHELVMDDIYIFQFKNGKGDWAYPNCNDMAIYKKAEIRDCFLSLPLQGPFYEGYWHLKCDLNKYGLFFEDSKLVNIPLNLVNYEQAPFNKNMRSYSPAELLKRFNDGYKFNINQFYKINNNSPHMEYDPEFIKKDFDKIKPEVFNIVNNHHFDMGKHLNFLKNNILNEGDLVFDVGANVGKNTDIYLQNKCKVICVDPQPSCINILNTKFSNNWDVKIEQVGLSSKEDILDFYICSTADSISTCSKDWINKGRFSYRNFNWDQKIKVPVTTLDNLIKKYGKPKFIKIDVEGFEFEVLKGLTTPVKFISFELNSELFDKAVNCINYLTNLGYKNFNFSIAETSEFAFKEWLSADEFIEYMKYLNKSRNWSDFWGLWGDVYAKY